MTNTTAHDDATTWRDLADQLTPDQIAKLEDLERRYHLAAMSPPKWWSSAPRTQADIASTLLSSARHYARENLAADVLADVLAAVPHPAGAVDVREWYDVDTPDTGRYFTGSSWVIEHSTTADEDIYVYIDGTQQRTGEVERLLHVH